MYNVNIMIFGKYYRDNTYIYMIYRVPFPLFPLLIANCLFFSKIIYVLTLFVLSEPDACCEFLTAMTTGERQTADMDLCMTANISLSP